MNPPRIPELVAFLTLLRLASPLAALAADAPTEKLSPLLGNAPASQAVNVGGTAIFFAPTHASYSMLGFRWFHNGQPLAEGGHFSGTQTDKLAITNAQLGDDGVYTVEVSQQDRKETSLPVMLAVSSAMPAQPTGIPDKIFDVTAFKAVGDGATDNTAAIQAAINAARDAGGGTVFIAKETSGPLYLSGPLTLYSKINFHIEAGATLRLLPRSSFGPRGAGNAMISASNASDLVISGHGTIDGQGADWWAAFRANSGTPRPYLVRFNSCSRVLVEDVTMQDSPMFHLAFSGNGSNLTALGLTITAPGNSPNTDAIDPSGHDIYIAHCNLSIGDDNIAIKGSSVHCANITVTNCTFGAGHGLSIGGQTNAGVENLVATNCTFNGTTSGIRLKADPTQGGLTQNISYSNMTMTNVQYPIVLYSYYIKVGNPGVASGANYITPARAAHDNASILADGFPAFFTTGGGTVRNRQANAYSVWKNISFTNITSTNGKGYNVIWGLPGYLVENVTFNNCRFSGDYGFEIYDATNIQFTGNSSVTANKSAPFIVGYPAGDADANNVTNSLVISSQPASQTVKVGDGVEFSVTVFASPAATYQWLKNGTPIASATDAKLKIASVSNADVGNYSVTVTNSAGSATSTAATLSIK
jgi:polygalacturonase